MKNLLGLGGSEDETSGSEAGNWVVVGGRDEAVQDEESEENEDGSEEKRVVEGSEGSGLVGGGTADRLGGLLGGCLLLSVLLVHGRMGLRTRRQQMLVQANLSVVESDEEETDSDQSDDGEQWVVLYSLHLVDGIEQVCNYDAQDIFPPGYRGEGAVEAMASEDQQDFEEKFKKSVLAVKWEVVEVLSLTSI